jgi:hypothetical protein
MSIDNFIQRTPRLSSKGSLIVHTGTTTSEISVGTNSTYLIANSSASVGINWATTTAFASPAMEHIYSTSTTAETSSIDITSIPATYGTLILQISNANVTSAGTEKSLRIELNNSSAGYYWISGGLGVGSQRGRNSSSFTMAYALTGGTNTHSVDHGGAIYINFTNYNTNKSKNFTFQYNASNIPQFGVCTWVNSSAITSIKLYPTDLVSFKSGLKVTLFGSSI